MITIICGRYSGRDATACYGGYTVRLDEIGRWSELKLEIVRSYATAYSTVISKYRLEHIYVDAFSGAGQHRSRATGEVVAGSPLSVLQVEPGFVEYHFIDLNRAKLDHLRCLVGHRSNVCIYNDDCNKVLLRDVFPRAQYKDYRRALCLLDPYGLHLDWEVIRTAGGVSQS